MIKGKKGLVKYQCRFSHLMPFYRTNYVTKLEECGHAHCNAPIVHKFVWVSDHTISIEDVSKEQFPFWGGWD